MVKLFEPLVLRGFTARNRIMVSPMQQYASPDNRASDYHLVHLGRYALGGAGIVIAEATAIEPAGRIATADIGLWEDSQIAPLKRVADFLSAYGSVPGIQLIHAGRKGAMQAPWDGAGPLTEADAARGEPPWPLIGPSPIAAGPGWQVPSEMTLADIRRNIGQWANGPMRRGARRGPASASSISTARTATCRTRSCRRCRTGGPMPTEVASRTGCASRSR